MEIDTKLEATLVSVYNKNITNDDVELLKEYLNSDNVEIQVAYGVCMWNSHEKCNWEIAIDCYTKAAQRNHAIAQYWLGNAYIFGTKVEKNYELGIYWLKRAMEQGVVMAKYHLAVCIFFGFGCQPDSIAALKLMNECARENVLEAKLFLAEESKLLDCYDTMVMEIDAEYKAKMTVNEDIALLVAKSYFNGYGFKQDYYKAYDIVNLQILKENVDAKYMKAICLENGLGVLKNKQKAKQLYHSIMNDKKKAKIKYLELCNVV